MEYPEALLAVLTEGQGAALKKPRPRKAATNREKLKSYADLAPGDSITVTYTGPLEPDSEDVTAQLVSVTKDT